MRHRRTPFSEIFYLRPGSFVKAFTAGGSRPGPFRAARGVLTGKSGKTAKKTARIVFFLHIIRFFVVYYNNIEFYRKNVAFFLKERYIYF
jgi:hypothetical protein